MLQIVHLTAPWDQILTALAIALPCIMGCLALIPRFSGKMFTYVPLAVLPALMLSLAAPFRFTWHDFILASSFALGPFHAIWLFVTAVLWLAAAWYGVYYLAHDAARGRYTFFFLGAMTGNIGLILAADPITFFTFFAMMSFLSYGLVIHDGTPEAKQAGRVYLSMAVAGEVLQFAAMSMLIFPMIGNSEPLTFQSLEYSANPLITGLLIVGFGIKAGLLGLHVWLPMAHPVAPTPASAVLSGSMIKAGLLGWMTLLPLGRIGMEMPLTSNVLIVLGLTGALVTALLGVLQMNPKAVLAYSSVSQMGLIITAVGVTLAQPSLFAVMKWIILIYVAHHAFAKSLLFLSVGLKTVRPLKRLEHSVFWGGTVLAALALTGAPLTAGMIAKALMKDTILNSQLDHAGLVVGVFTFAAVGTTLLMTRYLVLLSRMRHDEHHAVSRGIMLPWLLLLVMVIGFTFQLALHLWGNHFMPYVSLAPSMKNLWPLLAGVLLYVLVALAWKRAGWTAVRIPPGDLLHPVLRLANWGKIQTGVTLEKICSHKPLTSAPAVEAARKVMHAITQAENMLAMWRFGGCVFVVIAFLVIWASF